MKRWSVPFAIAALLAGGAAAKSASATQYHVVELPSLGGNNAIGNSINQFGLVAGESTLADDHTIRAVAWPFGIRTDLGPARPIPAAKAGAVPHSCRRPATSVSASCGRRARCAH